MQFSCCIACLTLQGCTRPTPCLGLDLAGMRLCTAVCNGLYKSHHFASRISGSQQQWYALYLSLTFCGCNLCT